LRAPACNDVRRSYSRFLKPLISVRISGQLQLVIGSPRWLSIKAGSRSSRCRRTSARRACGRAGRCTH